LGRCKFPDHIYKISIQVYLRLALSCTFCWCRNAAQNKDEIKVTFFSNVLVHPVFPADATEECDKSCSAQISAIFSRICRLVDQADYYIILIFYLLPPPHPFPHKWIDEKSRSEIWKSRINATPWISQYALAWNFRKKTCQFLSCTLSITTVIPIAVNK